MDLKQWVLWAFVLILQNFAFTFVSRARNSGSLARHMVASFFSNGVWFVSQILIFSQMFAIMSGKYGLKMAVFTSLYYTAFTMAGSLAAHYYSLKYEKGKGAVGATKKYAQIPTEEWAQFKAEFDRAKGLAEKAYDMAVGIIPDTTNIKARA